VARWAGGGCGERRQSGHSPVRRSGPPGPSSAERSAWVGGRPQLPGRAGTAHGPACGRESSSPDERSVPSCAGGCLEPCSREPPPVNRYCGFQIYVEHSTSYVRGNLALQPLIKLIQINSLSGTTPSSHLIPHTGGLPAFRGLRPLNMPSEISSTISTSLRRQTPLVFAPQRHFNYHILTLPPRGRPPAAVTAAGTYGRLLHFSASRSVGRSGPDLPLAFSE